MSLCFFNRLQDDKVGVFPDIHPAAVQHLLVVPLQHIPNVKSLGGEDVDLGMRGGRGGGLEIPRGGGGERGKGVCGEGGGGGAGVG